MVRAINPPLAEKRLFAVPDVQNAVTAGMAALPLKVLADFDVDPTLGKVEVHGRNGWDHAKGCAACGVLYQVGGLHLEDGGWGGDHGGSFVGRYGKKCPVGFPWRTVAGCYSLRGAAL